LSSLSNQRQQAQLLTELWEQWTTWVEFVTPSEWAEAKRYLPPTVSALPGRFRFDVAPFMREIVDCMGVENPVRECSLMKGVQITATTGVLENTLGYVIEHVKTAPVMIVTADADLGQIRLDSHLTPMVEHSGLSDLIRSSDTRNNRKTGKTNRKWEWFGGGYLIPYGANNANKLRSIPVRFLLNDEIDGWKDRVGKDGDPLKLVKDRTAAYELGRKILNISTPLIKGQSKIEKLYRQGDQRQYFVCCLSCGHSQTLRWRREHPETGEVTGIVWDYNDDGTLNKDSVRYLCEKCAHPHTNDDKVRLLSPDHGAEWRPTATAVSADVRSYHISALYSPPGMQTWAACVLKWLEAWDVEANKPRDLEALQVFYNNVLGEPYELRGRKLKFETVSQHRRHEYRYGEIPNSFAARYCGGAVRLLTASVDVHSEDLAVGVFGWTRERRPFLLNYWRFEGDTEQLDNPDTWGRLRALIESKVYIADDGRQYPIQLTLVDSGYRTDTVYRFCADYERGVFPVKGRDVPPKNVTVKEFSQFKTPLGNIYFGVTVDLYKDRWGAALRRSWDGQSMQSIGHFNAPLDATDKQLKELTVETKREKIDSTGKRVGFEWYRPAGAANELWDLLVYSSAALDIIAADVCKEELGLESVNWPLFWRHLEETEPYCQAA